MEEALNCYLYDFRPEREIQIWEIMNVTYLEYLHQEKITDKIVQKEIAKQILLISMGTLSEETNLSFEQLSKIFELWKKNFHAF